MSAIVDTYITYRIIKTLVTPWDEQDAYKYGIIDDKGKVLKKYKELNLKANTAKFDYLYIAKVFE